MKDALSNYSQKDPSWAGKRINNTRYTIGNSGCVVTSLGNLKQLHPDYINDQLTASGGYIGAAVRWDVAARVFNMNYSPVTNRPVMFPCIALTDHYRLQGYPTHFYILLENGQIIDPLDGRSKNNPYNKIGYRNIQSK